MPLPIQKKREIVFQILYSNDFSKIDEDLFVPFFMRQIKTTKKNILIAYTQVLKVLSNMEDIDKAIKKHSESYDFLRISKVELNVLRLAIYEMKYDNNIPSKVAITEAIRLTKKFSSSESGGFVNAVLDAILKDGT